jgi:opacity protein-like surface antigen
MRRVLLSALFFAFSVTPAAAADTGWSASLDWLYGERKEADIPGFIDIPRIRSQGFAVTGVYRFIDYFGVEGRVGTAFSKTSTVGIAGVPFEVKTSLDYFVSAFIKGILPLQPNRINAYVLVGATSFRGRTTIVGFEELTDTETNTGFSYGAGLELMATPKWGAKIEALRYYDKNDVSLDAVQLGVLWRF